MIISDRYRFSFIHIPKCAGTYVRSALQPLDDRNGYYTATVKQHAGLGLLDYVHIPLFTLRDHFRSDFEKVRSYWSFAVLRDPFARFPSSISQRFKMYGDKPIQDQEPGKIKAEIERSIDFLAKQPRNNHRLPAEYIHFQKQVDFVRLDGEPIVNTLYPVEAVDRLLTDMSQRVGYEVIGSRTGGLGPKSNRTFVYRNHFSRRIVESIRPITRRVRRTLPDGFTEWLESFFYVPRDQRMDSLCSSEYVSDFIRDYYREDLELWAKVKLRQSGD